MKKYFEYSLIMLLCLAVFGSGTYMYLRKEEISRTQKNQIKEPYSQNPQTVSIFLKLPGDSIMLVADFNNGVLNAYTNCRPDKFKEYFTVEGDRLFISDMIDRTGGIELESNGETLRCTGIQIVNLLYGNGGCPDLLRKEILEKFLTGMITGGLERDDFIYIVQNSKTDIIIPDTVGWSYNIGKIKNIIINQE